MSILSVSMLKNKYLSPDFPWFRPRSYLHFDNPLIKNSKKKDIDANLKEIFSQLIGFKSPDGYEADIPSKIATHQFLPFIQFQTKTPKLERLKNRKAVRKLLPKIRNIAYASHKDSFIYSYYAYILGKKYEQKLISENLQNNILAFRKIPIDENNSNGKANIHFAKDAFDIIKQQDNCFCLCLDIKQFFDNLNHDILKRTWLDILKINDDKLPADHYAVYKSLSQYSFVKFDEVLDALNISHTMLQKRKQKKDGYYIDKPLISLCKNMMDFRSRISRANLIRVNYHKGIPQGSPLSGLLANIYMLRFDIAIKKYLEKFSASYFRYCDDILIIVPSDDIEHLKDIQNYISFQIENQKLQIQESKTEIVFFKKIDNRTKIVLPQAKINPMLDAISRRIENLTT